MWRERSVKINEVYDAMPTPTWSMWLGKLTALILMLFAAGLPFRSRVLAQTSYGSIVGTVSDSTGAVVSDTSAGQSSFVGFQDLSGL